MILNNVIYDIRQFKGHDKNNLESAKEDIPELQDAESHIHMYYIITDHMIEKLEKLKEIIE